MPNLNKRFPVYSKFIKLYPAAYRQLYEEQILQTTADMLDNAGSSLPRSLVWLKVLSDLPLNITRQQLQYAGGIYTSDTKPYVKLSSTASGLLLIPFIAALLANALDKALNHQTLYGSWLWKRPVLSLWVLFLPLAALLLALISYTLYLTSQKKVSLAKRVFDVRRSLPIIMPAILSLGILFILAFHDSGRCWTQTPAHLLRHLSQTWQCTTNHQSLPVFRKLF